MGNTLGTHFKITTFGESHGKCIGCVIDGCPAGLTLSETDIQVFLDKRKPGQSALTSPRNEDDECEIVSGTFHGKTLGSPICILVKNTNQKSKDYNDINQIYRPGHADYTYAVKYGFKGQDIPPGGGRASARETIGRVAGGAVAKVFVQSLLPSVEIISYVNRVKNSVKTLDPAVTPQDDTKPRDETAKTQNHTTLTREMNDIILHAKQNGDSVGGTIHTTIHNLPAGFGEPVFDKLEAELAKAMLSIPAAKFFESGDGLASTYKFGSENNDAFEIESDEQRSATHGHTRYNIQTRTNHSGGIQGGISNGMPVTFTVGFKPVSTIFQKQNTVSRDGKEIVFAPQNGRHDPCVLPRAVIIVESMTWLVVAEILKAHLSSGRFDLKDMQNI